MTRYSYPIADTLDISFAAHRVNNGHVKHGNQQGGPKYRNTDLIVYTAAATLVSETKQEMWTPQNFVPVTVRDQDRAESQKAHKLFRRFTMLILGDSLTDFQKDVYTAYLQESATASNIGLIGYIPTFIENHRAEITYLQNLKETYYNSQFLELGSWITADVEILKCIYLQYHERYLYFAGHFGNLISFVQEEKYDIGEIVKLRAKAAKETPEKVSGLPMTSVNYVKIQKLEEIK